MAFFGPLKLSEANAPSTNTLPGQTGYTAYPQGQEFRIGGQAPGQDYIGLIAQELNKRFPGMSGLTSYPGQGGGGTSALGFTYNNPSQGAGTLEGVGGVSPESLTALLSGTGAPQTIEELIGRVSPGSPRQATAGQASTPSVSQPGQSSLAPSNQGMPLGPESGVGDVGGPEGTPGAPGGEGFGGFSGFGPGMNSTAAGITGGVLGGVLGMGGGILGMGAGALSGFTAGQNLAEAVNARGEFGLVSTLGMGRSANAMDDPTASSAPGGALGEAEGSSGPTGSSTGGDPGGPSGVGPDGSGPSGSPGGSPGDTGSPGGDPDGAEGDGAGGGGGGGGGGSSVICTHLFHQGYMSQKIFDADTAFGKQLDPQIYRGYMTWAPTVVNMMKTHPRLTPLVAAIATPWATHMAYRMGASAKDSMVGSWIMRLGTIGCRKLGRVQARESVSTV